MPKVDHEKIIADYMAAHGEAARYTIRYDNEWFIIRSGGLRWTERRYRAAEIKDMTDRLRAIAAEKEQSK